MLTWSPETKPQLPTGWKIHRTKRRFIAEKIFELTNEMWIISTYIYIYGWTNDGYHQVLDLRLVDDEIGIFLGNPLSNNGEKSSLTNSKSLKTHHENNVFFCCCLTGEWLTAFPGNKSWSSQNVFLKIHRSTTEWLMKFEAI